MDHRARPRRGRDLGLYRLHPALASAGRRSGACPGRHRRLQRAARSPKRRRPPGRSLRGCGLGRWPLGMGRLPVRLDRRLLHAAACRLLLGPAPLGASWQWLRLPSRTVGPREPRDGADQRTPDRRSRKPRHRAAHHRSRTANADHDGSRAPRERAALDDGSFQPWNPTNDDGARQPGDAANDDRPRQPRDATNDDRARQPRP